jgi:hypothetical protein
MEADYFLLEEAIGAGVAQVTELSAGGAVPELKFQNTGDKPVLLLDGEELVGAKQNRVLNLTILAGALSEVTIPVSCVEAGRWTQKTAAFSAAEAVQYAEGRVHRVSQVTAEMRRTGGRRSDQHAIWANIAEKATRMKAESDTGAMRAIYEKHHDTIEHYSRAFRHWERQAGLVYCIGGRRWGLDLLDHPAPMARTFSKLVRGYALDAIDVEGADAGQFELSNAKSFLERVGMTPGFTQPAVGLGKDVRIAGNDVTGAALWAEERYVHVCAFSAAGDGGPETRILRPSLRRR